MTSKLRLFGSLALAVVGAAAAHGQAFGGNFTEAQIYGIGAYTLDGRHATYTSQFAGYYFAYHGPYGAGQYSFYDNLNANVNGTLAEGFGYSFATPNGQVSSNGTVETAIEFTNGHVYGINLDFTGATTSASSAYQLHTGDIGDALGLAEILYSTTTGFYTLQWSECEATADNYFGFGNYTSGANYDPSHGAVGSSTFSGYGSPGYVTATYSLYDHWSLYIAPYSSIVVTEVSYEAHYAKSMRSNSVPAPAAVAPFVVGLLGALKRRAKKR